MDELTVQCEAVGGGVDPGALGERLEEMLREGLGIPVPVEVIDAGTVPRSGGKAVRVVDRRGPG